MPYILFVLRYFDLLPVAMLLPASRCMALLRFVLLFALICFAVDCVSLHSVALRCPALHCIPLFACLRFALQHFVLLCLTLRLFALICVVLHRAALLRIDLHCFAFSFTALPRMVFFCNALLSFALPALSQRIVGDWGNLLQGPQGNRHDVRSLGTAGLGNVARPFQQTYKNPSRQTPEK